MSSGALFSQHTVDDGAGVKDIASSETIESAAAMTVASLRGDSELEIDTEAMADAAMTETDNNGDNKEADDSDDTDRDGVDNDNAELTASESAESQSADLSSAAAAYAALVKSPTDRTDDSNIKRSGSMTALSSDSSPATITRPPPSPSQAAPPQKSFLSRFFSSSIPPPNIGRNTSASSTNSATSQSETVADIFTSTASADKLRLVITNTAYAAGISERSIIQ